MTTKLGFAIGISLNFILSSAWGGITHAELAYSSKAPIRAQEYKPLEIGQKKMMTENYTGINSYYYLKRLSENHYQVEVPIRFVPEKAPDETTLRPARQRAKQMKRIVDSCLALFNPEFKGPNGERMTVTQTTRGLPYQIKVHRSRADYLKIYNMRPPEDRNYGVLPLADAANYPFAEFSDESQKEKVCLFVLHEILHLAGLTDEYIDPHHTCRDTSNRFHSLMGEVRTKEEKLSMIDLDLKRFDFYQGNWVSRTECICPFKTAKKCEQELSQFINSGSVGYCPTSFNQKDLKMRFNPERKNQWSKGKSKTYFVERTFEYTPQFDEYKKLQLIRERVASEPKSSVTPDLVAVIIYPGHEMNRPYYEKSVGAYVSPSKELACPQVPH